MADICPSVLSFNAHDYRAQMELVAGYAKRVHIDLMDGIFTPTTSPTLEQVWWPNNLSADIHLMHERPLERLAQLEHLAPELVIWHYEAKVDHKELMRQLHLADIKCGLALLPKTPAKAIFPLLPRLDHVLIFSGDLGLYGGKANLNLLNKAKAIKEINPDIELGWDGGVNDQNARQIAEAGVSVLNVGGYLAQAPDPQAAYAKLVSVTS